MASMIRTENPPGVDSYFGASESHSSADDENVGPDQISEDWALNVLILDLAKDTSDEELKDMKLLCSGTGGFGKAVLAKITTPRDLFDSLRTRGLLDSNNLLFLQGLIWHTGNKINHQKIITYSKRMQQTPLHFFTASKEPENGYAYVRFHVAGRETDRRKINCIIRTVADILQVPAECVLWKGAEPFESIVITLMIPDRALEALLNLTKEERGYLLDLHIDKFITDGGVELILKGSKYQAPPALRERDEIDRLLKKEKDLEKLIEDMEVNLLEKKKQLDVTTPLQAENTELQQKLTNVSINAHTIEKCYSNAIITLATLVNIILNDHPNEADIVSREKGWAYQKYCLAKAQKAVPEHLDLIQEIMDTASLNSFLAEREMWRKQIDCMKTHVDFMQNQTLSLLSLISRKQSIFFPAQATLELRQQMFELTKPTAIVSPTIIYQETLQFPTLFAMPLPDPYASVLQQISMRLTEEQKLELGKHANFELKEENLLLSDPNTFMHILMSKETAPYRKAGDFERRVLGKINLLNDTDLLQYARQLFRDADTQLPINSTPVTKRKEKSRHWHVLSHKKVPRKGYKAKYN